MARRNFVVAVTSLLLTAALGCSRDTIVEDIAFEDLNPVKGQILYRGEPIVDAAIRLHPVAPSAAASFAAQSAAIVSSVTDEQGNFEVFTFRPEGKGKGAPAGEYRLSISWRGPLQGLTKDQEDELKEKLPAKYTRPQTSQLTVKVTPGDNAIDAIALQ